MRALLFSLLGLTLLAVALSHHDNEEEHLLDSLLDAYVDRDDAKREDSINNYVDNILRKCLEKVRTILQTKEPYDIPDLGTKQVSDKNVHVTVTLTHVKEYNASTFVVNRLKNNLFKMTEEYDLTFPTLEIEGDYKINGTVLGKAVNGNGHFKVWVTNLHTWGKVYAGIKKRSVQIKKLNIDYTVESVTAKATGLKVEGLTSEEVDKLLGTELQRYFTDNERVVSDTIADKVIEEANTFLQGKSISDLIAWLKHFITPPKILI